MSNDPPATDPPATDPSATDPSTTDDGPPADSSTTDAPSAADSTLDSLADPESLRDREEVRFTDETAVHDDRDHCNTDIDGRAVVGVTNDDGEVLLAVHREETVAMLPHGRVEAGDDWLTTARRKVEITTDLPFEIDGVEAVREIDHVVEGEDDPHATTYGVVFRASLAGDSADADDTADADDPADDPANVADPSTDDNDHWDADWFDAVPENTPPGSGLVADDIRLFVN